MATTVWINETEDEVIEMQKQVEEIKRVAVLAREIGWVGTPQDRCNRDCWGTLGVNLAVLQLKTEEVLTEIKRMWEV